MSFWQSKPGATLVVLMLCCAVTIGLAGFRVLAVTHPTREHDVIDFDSMRMNVQRVRFPAVDGPMLTGVFLDGDGEKPPVLLCHDLDSSKESLVGVAMQLNSRGFPTLLFDFRGHGESEGGPSTLGLTEKRDILGALDYLGGQARSELKRVGIYGVGMGAHAAVLAA